MLPAAAAFTVALTVVLLWSVAAKLSDMVRGRRQFLDVLPGPRALRPWIGAAVLAVELATAVLLLVRSRPGLWLAAALFVVLGIASWRIPEGKQCRCFGGALEFGRSRRGRVFRNALLAALALIAALAAVAAPLPAPSFQTTVLGLMVVALIVSADSLSRTVSNAQPARQP